MFARTVLLEASAQIQPEPKLSLALMATLRPQQSKLLVNRALLATNAHQTTLCPLPAPMASILSELHGSANPVPPATAVPAKAKSLWLVPWVQAQLPASKLALLVPTAKNAPRSSQRRRRPALRAIIPLRNRDNRRFASSVRRDISAQEAPTICSQNRARQDHTLSDLEMPHAHNVQQAMLVLSRMLPHMHAQLAMNNCRQAKLLASQPTQVLRLPAILETTLILIQTPVVSVLKVSSANR